MYEDIHNCRVIQRDFSALRILCVPPSFILVSFWLLQPLTIFTISSILTEFLAIEITLPFQTGFFYIVTCIILFKRCHKSSLSPFAWSGIVGEGTQTQSPGMVSPLWASHLPLLSLDLPYLLNEGHINTYPSNLTVAEKTRFFKKRLLLNLQ